MITRINYLRIISVMITDWETDFTDLRANDFGNLGKDSSGNTFFGKHAVIFTEIIGHPQTCVYPDVCLGIAHVSGKVPSLGTRGLVDTQCICPFRPTDSLGRKGQIHCVSTRPLVPREGTLPDTWAIPKHTSG